MAIPSPTPQNRPGLVLIGPIPPPPFGCSNLNWSLLQAAGQSRFRFIHIDTTDRRPYFNYGQLDFVNVYLALKHLAQLVWVLLTQSVRIVYLTVSTTPLAYLRDGLFIVIARLFGKKIVAHSHGRENRLFYDRSNPVLRWFIRTTLGSVTHAACEGEIMRPVVFRGLIANEKVWAVPNGAADLYEGRDPVALRPAQTPEGRLQVAFVAHMWEPKGYREILAVAPEVLQACPAASFVFAGRWASPEEEAATRQLVAELGLEPHVRFLGLISDEAKAQLLVESHVFAFPSKFWTEGQPLSVIDAMAAGLPVIASAVGCIPENVPDGTHSILIEMGDRAALRAGLIALLTDPELRRRMGAANRQRFLTHYHERVFAQGMERLFVHVDTV